MPSRMAARGAEKAISKLWSLVSAPEDLSALINDVHDVQVAFQSAKGALEMLPTGHGIAASQLEDLQNLSIRAQDKLLELERLINGHLLKRKTSNKDTRCRRIPWVLQQGSTA
ncbi:MAG: hypothetical protein M1820_006541 [Bogoriella megaspora]|nr:MAG: hypothetical protein M1820_006541 [Bogoriella megaspora]